MPGTFGRLFSRSDRSRAVWFGERYGGAGTDGVGPTKSSSNIRTIKLENDPEEWRRVFRKSRPSGMEGIMERTARSRLQQRQGTAHLPSRNRRNYIVRVPRPACSPARRSVS